MNTLKNKLLLALVFLAIFSLQSKAQDSIQKTKMLSLERVGIGFQRPIIESIHNSKILNPLTTKTDIDFSIYSKINLRFSLGHLSHYFIEVGDVYPPPNSSYIVNYIGYSRNTIAKSFSFASFFNVFDTIRFKNKFNVQIGAALSYLDIFVLQEWNTYAVEIFDKNEYSPMFQLNYTYAKAMGLEVFSDAFYTFKSMLQVGVSAGFNTALFGKTEYAGGSWALEGDSFRGYLWYDHFYYGISLRYLLK